MTAAVMAVVAGSSLIESAELRVAGLLLLMACVLTGSGFVLRQRRAPSPLIPADALSSPNLRSGTAVSFVNTATTSSAMVLATLLLQNKLGASPIQAGALLISFSLAVIVGSSLSRPLSEKISAHRMAALGLTLIAAGCAALAATYGTWWGVVAGAAVAGAGIGISSVAGTTIGTDVPEHFERLRFWRVEHGRATRHRHWRGGAPPAGFHNQRRPNSRNGGGLDSRSCDRRRNSPVGRQSQGVDEKGFPFPGAVDRI